MPDVAAAARARLTQLVARECFAPAHSEPLLRRYGMGLARGATTPWSIGLEIEFMPLAAAGEPVWPTGSEGADGLDSLVAVRACARRHGWVEHAGPYGLAAWQTPDGGWLTFEPGGQLEYASPVCPDLDTLEQCTRGVLLRLGEDFARRGLRLLARGLDPRTPLCDTRRVLTAERYLRQEQHYDRRGVEGRRMMRQSLALHVNVGIPGLPADGWWAANALVPALVAIFANSPRIEGRESGWRSERGRLWRSLDPSRTGAFAPRDGAVDADPVPDYVDFALQAEVFSFGPPGRTLAEHLDAGPVDDDDLRRHLSTLFPEVRPRGYLELRCMDALPLNEALTAAALVTGVLSSSPSLRRRVVRELPPVSAQRLSQAARCGLTDGDLRAEAEQVIVWAIEGLSDDGAAGSSSQRWIERLDQLLHGAVRRGLDPGARLADDLL